MTSAIMLLALVTEAALGWPGALYRRIGHPVTWMGRLIDVLDHRLNRVQDTAAQRRRAGMLAALAVIATGVGLSGALLWLLPGGVLGAVLTGLIAATLVAARSLHDHVRAVALPLSQGDIPAARAAVAMIVGRDPARLDQPGIARAALESLAENASDGVVAPIFWGVLLGLPGIVAYKAINTLDSMIGHRTPRHADFGRFAARLDDWVNWLPARLTGVLLALACGRPVPVIAVMRRDAPRHRSPNAGWPEAAMAAALGCRLSGPRAYQGGIEAEPWLNPDHSDPTPRDLARGLALYRRMLALLALLLLCGAVFG